MEFKPTERIYKTRIAYGAKEYGTNTAKPPGFDIQKSKAGIGKFKHGLFSPGIKAWKFE